MLDPAVIEWVSTAAARAVLFTKHGSGSLRSPPSLVGPYLFLNEASDLEHTRVKAFSLLEGKDLIRDPDLATAKEIELAGWS